MPAHGVRVAEESGDGEGGRCDPRARARSVPGDGGRGRRGARRAAVGQGVLRAHQRQT
ncbi:hypothetical protein EMIT0111MI5_130048 [Burkholderia sp. IT-111MI5]